MTRELTEEGPRLEVHFSDDELEKIQEGLNGAGYRGGDHQSTRERRFRHPGGSTVRIFPLVGLLYVYPPGGTRRQTGPIAPFSPLKREIEGCNASYAPGSEEGDPSASSSSDADNDPAASGDDAGTGDPPTDDNGDTSGDDE